MNKQKITNNITIPNKDLEILKKHFSYCFDKNGNFDFEKFKQELSKNEIDFSKESYGMDWLGKSYARLLASDEATTLLKKDEDWNKKNQDSQNLLIKGDNLEVLKHLSNAYYEKIKMIYIDPPYNTGSDGFVYQDDRKFTYQELSKLAGVNNEKAKRILEFTQSKSNSHSAWLTFMYPRLYIAKQLLKDDGVIFVSIDDNEVAQLRLLMDEIFGEDNFVGETIRQTRKGGGSMSKYISSDHDYVLLYSKNKTSLDRIYIPFNKDYLKRYKEKDERGLYFWDTYSRNRQGSSNFYEIKTPDGKKIKNAWINPENKFKELLENKEIRFKKIKGNNWSVQVKQRLNNNGQILRSIINETTNEFGTKRIKELFNELFFTYPKPVELLKILISTINEPNSIILDFFAGSGTTGDAVMQLNAEDGGNRKYILVQLPEEIDKKKNKTAYDFVKDELGVEKPTIFEITKERLIRAGKKIQEDNKDKDLSKIDFGFKIFETTPIWEDYNLEAEKFDVQTRLFDETKLKDKDLQILLTTWKTYDGIALTQDLVEINLEGYKGHYFENKLYLIDKGFKTKNLKKLLEEIDKNPNFNPETIISFGYNFESKVLREIAENIKNYTNKKHIDIDFITRY